MTHIADLLGQDIGHPAILTATGLPALDRVAEGGFPTRGLWIVTGGPRQGASTLLREWVARIAIASTPTRLLGPRLDPVATARLVEGSTRPVQAGWEDVPLTIERRSKLPRVLDAGAALAVDRADLVAQATPLALRELADEGRFVLIDLPRHELLMHDHPGAELRHDWAEVADVVVEIRVRGGTFGAWRLQEGEVQIQVLLNRRGFLTELCACWVYGRLPITQMWDDDGVTWVQREVLEGGPALLDGIPTADRDAWRQIGVPLQETFTEHWKRSHCACPLHEAQGGS